MRRMRSRWARGLLVWSLVLLGAMIVVAFDAVRGLYEAQQACFFQNVPCPQAGDPKEIQLTFAFFGIPLIWLIGLVIGIAGWAIKERSRRLRT